MAKKKEAVEVPVAADAMEEPATTKDPVAAAMPDGEVKVSVGYVKRKPKAEGKTAHGITIRHW